LAVSICIFFGLDGTLLAASAAETHKERGPVDWGQTYIEATGTALAPVNAKGPQGKALARRGAVIDLQRNLLKALSVQIGSRAAPDRDFSADGPARGFIRGVEILGGRWDGKSYTVTGRVRAARLRAVYERCVQNAAEEYP
jgi:hypothetical protein